jgi:hypothetical protein
MLLGDLFKLSAYINLFHIINVVLYSLKPNSALLLSLTYNLLELAPYSLQLGNMETHEKIMDIK